MDIRDQETPIMNTNLSLQKREPNSKAVIPALDVVGRIKMSQKRDDSKIKIDIPLIEDIEDMNDKKNIHVIKVRKSKESNQTKEEKKRIKGSGQVRKRNFRPFESKNPRERTACPKCNSVSVVKRISTQDYVCNRCGWKGDGIIKVKY